MEQKRTLGRGALGAAVLMATLYGADAIYPHWDWSCSSQHLAFGLVSGPSQIPEFVNDAQARVVQPTLPEGCSAHAQNMARNVVDWLLR